jgi:hypothetical protein
MNAHAMSYPSLQRRLMVERRSRALFLRRTTQHVSSHCLAREVGRAAIALAGLASWSVILLLLAG